MRPINLIPEQERGNRRSAAGGNPLAYLLVGGLVVLLAGVVTLVLTSNQISDREGEVARLRAEKAAVTANAERLSAYTSFQQVAEQRTRTIAELADARFDWARVIQQLSLVLPSNVYFTDLTGSAGGEAGGEAAAGVSGPSLTIAGCAPGQEAVAAFVASLKEIDGVTRVELQSSAAAESEGQAGRSPCSVGRKALFTIVVAFDEAPPSPDSSAGALEPEASESESGESGSGSSESGSEGASEEGSATESTQAAATPGTTEGTG